MNVSMPKLKGSSIFTPAAPGQPAIVLLIIENSYATSNIWHELRSGCLNKLVEMFEGANSGSPMTVFVLESMPLQDGIISPGINPQLCLGDGFQNLRFNFDSGNRLSIELLEHGIDYLNSFRLRNCLLSLHLFVVASTSPLVPCNGFNTVDVAYSPWRELARKIAQAGIHLHLVHSPYEDMTSLTTLFEETVQLGSYAESQVPFQSKFLIRLSGRLSNVNVAGKLNQQSSMNSPDSLVDSSSVPQEDDEFPPSLVSQLQQVHGLTKKKVYGAKPVRQPFIGERVERPPNKYQHKVSQALTVDPSPTDLAKLVSAQSSSGRAVSRSRVERLTRRTQASPTDIYCRPMLGSRRHSRLPTPETDSLPSPIAVPLHGDVSPICYNPTQPIPSPIEVYSTLPQVPSSDFVPISCDGDPLGESIWPTPPFSPVAPLYSSFMPSEYHSLTANPAYPDLPQPFEESGLVHPHPSIYNSTTLFETPTVQGSLPRPTQTAGTGYIPTKSTLLYPENDRPFLFGNELEDIQRTQEPLKEDPVLFSFPHPAKANNTQFGGKFFIESGQESPPLSPFIRYDDVLPYNVFYPPKCELPPRNLASYTIPGNDPTSMNEYPSQAYPTNSSGSSSSLTGWAG